MSIISIDSGTTTTKVIEYSNGNIFNKAVFNNKEYSNSNIEDLLSLFITNNNINVDDIEKIVVTGINYDKLSFEKYKSEYNIPVYKVEEFKAIAEAGKYLSGKDNILVASIGTGTAFVRVEGSSVKHLGGTRSRSRNSNKFV